MDSSSRLLEATVDRDEESARLVRSGPVELNDVPTVDVENCPSEIVVYKDDSDSLDESVMLVSNSLGAVDPISDGSSVLNVDTVIDSDEDGTDSIGRFEGESVLVSEETEVASVFGVATDVVEPGTSAGSIVVESVED